MKSWRQWPGFPHPVYACQGPGSSLCLDEEKQRWRDAAGLAQTLNGSEKVTVGRL